MFHFIGLVGFFSLFLIGDSIMVYPKSDPMAPSGMGYGDCMTCEEFGKFARFNPYSVLDQSWMVFYYWSPVSYKGAVFNFTVPTFNDIDIMKAILSPYVKTEISWEDIKLYISSPFMAALVQTGDRGQHDLYDLPQLDRVPKNYEIKPLKVILKQKGKYLGFMVCENKFVYALARKKEMPTLKEVQEAATTIGYRARGGKSYLYMGNDWMPIGDAHEENVYGPGMIHLKG